MPGFSEPQPVIYFRTFTKVLEGNPMANTAPADDAIKARLECALAVAQQAGRRTLDYFRSPDLAVERKSDNSPVTIADRDAETFLRKSILQDFPQDGIVGEEFGDVEGSSDFRWILDPIDGTKSFISGAPLYGTLVGVEHAGRSVIGVIVIPALDECAYAAVGQGAWHIMGDAAPTPARVSQRTSLAEGLFLTSQVDTFARRNATEAYFALEKAASITRTWGDCYGYLMVATGRADAMVDPMMNLWDAAAILPILQEAGGAFTDWQGEPVVTSGEGIGAAPGVLQEVLEITSRFPRLSEVTQPKAIEHRG